MEIIAYHGSNVSFDEFNENFLGSHYGENESGFCFGTVEEAEACAMDFEDGEIFIYEVKLTINKPVDLSDFNFPARQRASSVYDMNRGSIQDAIWNQDADGAIIKSSDGECDFYLVCSASQIEILGITKN